MANISAQMVKELRESTGAGMMDCKAALTETNGDMTAAQDWLRKKGLSKAAKKAGRNATGFLRSLGQTFLAQPILRRRHVSVRLGEGCLAVHHPGAGRLAQLLYHLCADICHRTLSFIRSGHSARRAALV